MILIDAIILTLLNGFDELDWTLARYTNYIVSLRGSIKSSPLSFFALLLSISIGIPLTPLMGRTSAIPMVILFILFAYITDKRYYDKKSEIIARLEGSFLQGIWARRVLTLSFILLPVILIVIIRLYFNS